MTFDDIVINNRETNSSFHLKLAQNWRIRGEPKLLHSPLIYAAFEYRLAIERIVFELYFLMEKENLLPGKLFSKAELKKVDSFSSITKIIFQNAKNKNLLFRALIFNKTFASVFALSKAKLSLPDIGKLQKY